jgi:hypothetical protein
VQAQFLQDLQFLLIDPADLQFIYRAAGIPY